FVFDGLHLFHSLLQVMRIFQDGAQMLRSSCQAGREFSKEVEKLGFARDKAEHDTQVELELENGKLSHVQACRRKDSRPSTCNTSISFRPRVSLVVYMHNMFHRELSIALRRSQTFVSKQFLNRPQVRSFFEHVRAKGMP